MNMDQLKILIVIIGIVGVIFGLMHPLILNLKTQAVQSQWDDRRKIKIGRHWD
jgi:hypothetical protein